MSLGLAAVLDVDDDEVGVAPGAVGDVAVDDAVVAAVAAGLGRPVRRLAGGEVHAGQPEASGLAGLGRVGHVDGDEDVVGEALDQRRGVGPAAADVPDAVDAAAVDGQEADLPGLGRLRDVVDRHAGGPVALALGLGLGVEVGLALVVVLLVGELGLRPHVLGVHDQQQVVEGLAVQVPGVVGAGVVAERLRVPRIAHVDDAEAVGEQVADVGVALVHHHLHRVRTAALVAVADGAQVVRVGWLGDVRGGHARLHVGQRRRPERRLGFSRTASLSSG